MLIVLTKTGYPTPIAIDVDSILKLTPNTFDADALVTHIEFINSESEITGGTICVVESFNEIVDKLSKADQIII